MIEKQACLHTAIGRHAKTMAHPGFAKRLPGGGSVAGFIAAAKRREAFKAAAESGGAHAAGSRVSAADVPATAATAGTQAGGAARHFPVF